MIASLGQLTVEPVRKGGRTPRRFDCGQHGQLTIGQIAGISGCSYAAVKWRIANGFKGAELCLSRRTRPTKRRSEHRIPTMVTACRIALHFNGRVPTIKELRAFRPMSQNTATRWRQAMRDALEAA